MSIFDTDFLLTKSNRVKFFHKFTKFTEPTLKKKSLFECDILYQKTNGNLVAYFLKILENKMLLLQVNFTLLIYYIFIKGFQRRQ